MSLNEISKNLSINTKVNVLKQLNEVLETAQAAVSFWRTKLISYKGEQFSFNELKQNAPSWQPISFALTTIGALGAAYYLYNRYSSSRSLSCEINTAPMSPEGIIHSPVYGDLMKDPEVLFHGINLAIWKIPSILKLGILSKSAASINKITLGFNYGSQSNLGIRNGYNGEDYISCARSPRHPDAIGDKFGAFGLYITNGISFAIRGISAIDVSRLGKSYNSMIPGEAMANWAIPPEAIIGLTVPENLWRTKIIDINFLQGGALWTFHLRCQSLLKYLDGKIDIKYPNLEGSIAAPIKTKDERVKLETLLNGLLLRYFSSQIDVETACLIDLLKIYIPGELKLYDTKGIEIPR